MSEGQLDLEKISELATGETEDFKQKVNNLELTLSDFRTLKDVETSGQNREEIIKFLERKIRKENVSVYLGVAEEDVGEISDLLNQIEKIESVEEFEDEEADIDRDNLIDLVGGTVKDLKEFVEDRPLTHEQLKDLLSAEERVKDRKTAKKYLKKMIKKRKIGEDVHHAQEDLNKLKKDLEQLDNDEEFEELNIDIKERNKKSEEGDQEDRDKTKDEDKQDKNEDEDEEENSEDEKDKEAEESPDSNITELDEKREIAKDLDLDMEDDELDEFTLNDLKKISSEKSHRTEIIEKLVDEGMNEAELHKSSTDDLEKILESIEDKEDSSEEHEEMKNEAEEDLEMLMGAIRRESESEEDSGKNTREKIMDMKTKIQDKLDRSGDEEEKDSSSVDVDKVDEILDQYRNLGQEEAIIKTAHIMKGFLENTLEIEREMTYKELAENLPENDPIMEDLKDFFLKMHREQYTGKLEVEDVESTIATCQDAIYKLS